MALVDLSEIEGERVWGLPVKDRDRVVALIQLLNPDASQYNLLTIDGEPTSKARPRFGGSGQVYTPTKQREAEAKLGWHFKRAFREPMSGNIAVVCIFYRSNHSRVDVDNMLKNVMDAANRIIWHDDYQVTAMFGSLELDKERPRTVIGITSHVSTLSRSAVAPKVCLGCGKMFSPQCHATNHRTSYCSRKCKETKGAPSLDVLVPCVQCQVPFRRRHYAQTVCSNECRYARKSITTRINPVAYCAHCGKQLARTNARRCRECWKQNSKIPMR